MVVVGVVVSEAEEIVGEVRRSGLVKELLLGCQLGDVGNVPLSRGRLLVLRLLPVVVKAAIERAAVHEGDV